MAEETIEIAKEAIENELNCSICLETYTDPKILQCFHVYCQKCLVKLVVRDQQGQLSLSCPICRQVTPVPASGTAGLQSAFHINRLLEILDQQKKGKGEPASAERLDSKAESLSLHVNSALNCSEHGGREVELFCETCGKLVCLKCVIKGGDHHSHDCKDIAESFERFREEVTPSLEPMEKKMTTISEVLVQLDSQYEEITDQQAAIEAEIRDSSKQLHKIIEKRENELIDQLEQITKTKLKRLATQIDQIETLQAQLSSCLEFTKNSLQTEIEQREVLALKTVVLKQVSELTMEPQSDIFALSVEADVVFSGSADAAAVCEHYGRVYAMDSPDLSKFVATGKGREEAEDASSSCESESCKDLLVELVSEITGHCVRPVVEWRGPEQYVTSYQTKGKHQLHIKTGGQHITGSPFSLAVKQPVEKLGTPILAIDLPKEPWGVAVTGKGEVVVTEWGRHCVSVFSQCGKVLQSFGTCGSGRGQFQCPSGVAVDGEGNILVTDKVNTCIQKFTTDGCLLKSRPLMYRAYGVAYSASNNMLYVVNGENHHIQILNSDLVPISLFGEKGRGEGQFFRPRGVAIDNTGRVYVADSGNDRIQVFTSEGEFLSMFGRRGEDRGELNWPFGVAVDASDLVYVSEYDSHRVSVFTSEGKFVTLFGGMGREPGQFDTPRGLAVDSFGVVYVCDRNNNSVQIF